MTPCNLRVIVVSSLSSDSGSNLRARYIAQSLKNAGAQVKFINGVNSMPFMLNYIISMLLYLRIIFIPCDVIIGLKPLLNITLVMMVKRLIRKITIIDVDDLDFGYRTGFLSNLNRMLQLPFPRRFSLISYHTDKLHPFIQKTFTVPENKLYKLPQGVDISLYSPKDITDFKKEIIAKYNLKEKRIVVYAGHLNIASDLDAIFKIIKIAHSKMQTLRFLVIGGGPLYKHFCKLANKLQVDDITVFTGHLLPKDVVNYLLLGEAGIVYYKDIEVNYYRESMKLREMLALGLKVICNNVGDLSRFIDYTYQVESSYETVARELVRVIEEGGDKREIHGMDFVRNNLDWDKIGKEFSHKIISMTNVAPHDKTCLTIKPKLNLSILKPNKSAAGSNYQLTSNINKAQSLIAEPSKDIVINESTSSVDEGILNTPVLKQALELTTIPNSQPKTQFLMTTQRSLTRRGVIWLGQTCNQHCKFCYFITRVHSKDHPEHSFMPLEKAKKICTILANFYRNTSIDIEGGEPTLYPQILDLIRHCVKSSLYPTLITNGLILDNIDLCRQYKETGIRDFKISIHGLANIHDELVGRKGAHQRQLKALCNLQKVGIPFRFNIVLTPHVIPQIIDLARFAVETGALAVNWLGFNPHEDQLDRKERYLFFPNYTEMRGPLTEALDILGKANIEANVRYFPHCMVEDRHRKSIYHFQQLFYDHREWDWCSWAWTTLPPQRSSQGDISNPVTLNSLWWWLYLIGPIRWTAKIPYLNLLISIKRMVNIPWIRSMLEVSQQLMSSAPINMDTNIKKILYNRVARLHSRVNCNSIYVKSCQRCAAKEICCGIQKDYCHLYGNGENVPIEANTPITDPLHYIQQQLKIVEKEDEAWAL